MQEFNEGDLVEAVLGEQAIRGRVAQVVGDPSIHVVAGPLTWDHNIQSLASVGFVFNVIEKAAPKLPTEPGIYESKLFPIARGNAPYLLTSSGWSMEADDLDLDHMRRLAPLTRLEPVPVTAKKVLDAIRQRIGSIDSAHDFQSVATQFGVTE